MNFFLDHCVPRSVGRRLAEAGHDVIELIECLPANSADPVVIGKADELDAVLVSLNGDFADITAYPPAQHQGIIALQIRNRPESIQPLMDILIAFLVAHPHRSYLNGKLLVAEPHRIRIRT